MADTKLLFLVQRPPYKSENPRLAITHAISYQTVDLFLEEGETVTPVLAFVGDGVLNCLKDQKSIQTYDTTSTETHVKNSLLLDIKVIVCKEDLERLGISHDRLADAADMGAESSINVAPFVEIMKEMETSKHLLCF
ncbi:MAG: DsrE family protein [Nitrospirae bacterium]|nr:DsrE family protein [Nitrospirota bacterium]